MHGHARPEDIDRVEKCVAGLVQQAHCPSATGRPARRHAVAPLRRQRGASSTFGAVSDCSSMCVSHKTATRQRIETRIEHLEITRDRARPAKRARLPRTATPTASCSYQRAVVEVECQQPDATRRYPPKAAGDHQMEMRNASRQARKLKRAESSRTEGDAFLGYSERPSSQGY